MVVFLRGIVNYLGLLWAYTVSNGFQSTHAQFLSLENGLENSYILMLFPISVQHKLVRQ